MNKYQAVIIGFGKAGKTLAVTLAKAGWRVALIEQSNAMYGGTCINIGCIPTKTLVHDAQQHTDFVRAIQRKNEVVNFLRNKNFHNLADMPNIDVIDGQAEFINNHSLRVHRPEGNLEIHGEKIFINTGAQAVVPPIPGITTTPGVYDSTGLLNLKELPGHLGILGGGYIGVEFASMFANFGSKVTILESASLFCLGKIGILLIISRRFYAIRASILSSMPMWSESVTMKIKCKCIASTPNWRWMHC